MLQTSTYRDIPYHAFFGRMIIPAVILYLFFFPAVGLLATTQMYRNFEREHGQGALMAPKIIENTGYWNASVKHWEHVKQHWSEYPSDLCDHPQSDFNTKNCEMIRDRRWMASLLLLAPLLLTAVGIVILRDQMVFIFRRAHRLVSGDLKQGAAVFAVVTNPPEMDGTVFTWLKCMRVISMKPEKGAQCKVLIPVDAELPSPGEGFKLFRLNEEYFVGERHLPHVTVLRG